MAIANGGFFHIDLPAAPSLLPQWPSNSNGTYTVRPPSPSLPVVGTSALPRNQQQRRPYLFVFPPLNLLEVLYMHPCRLQGWRYWKEEWKGRRQQRKREERRFLGISEKTNKNKITYLYYVEAQVIPILQELRLIMKFQVLQTNFCSSTIY